MAVHLTVGLSVLQRVGLRGILSSFSSDAGAWDRFRFWLLSLPTAAFLAPLLASVLRMGGLDAWRLRAKIGCLVVAWLATASVARRLGRHERIVGFLLLFPLVGSLAQVLGSVRGLHPSFWPSADIVALHARWVSIPIIGAVVATGVSRMASIWRVTAYARCVAMFACCYLLTGMIRLAHGYMDPHYSIRQASRDLETLLAKSPSIAVSRAEALFNENTLAYASFNRRDTREKPENLVVGFAFRGDEEWLKQNYRPVKVYNLYVSPEYAEYSRGLHQLDAPLPFRNEVVATVYARRRAPGEQ
jgi:hypothetical protein